jgi:hypothetical protein
MLLALATSSPGTGLSSIVIVSHRRSRDAAPFWLDQPHRWGLVLATQSRGAPAGPASSGPGLLGMLAMQEHQ